MQTFDTGFDRSVTTASRDFAVDNYEAQNVTMNAQQHWMELPSPCSNGQTSAEVSIDPLSEHGYAREAQSCDPLIEQPKQNK